MHPDLHNSGGNAENPVALTVKLKPLAIYTRNLLLKRLPYCIIEKKRLRIYLFYIHNFLKAKINLQHYIKANSRKKNVLISPIHLSKTNF